MRASEQALPLPRAKLLSLQSRHFHLWLLFPLQPLSRLRQRSRRLLLSPPHHLSRQQQRSHQLLLSPPSHLSRLRQRSRRLLLSPPGHLSRLRQRSRQLLLSPPGHLSRLRQRSRRLLLSPTLHLSCLRQRSRRLLLSPTLHLSCQQQYYHPLFPRQLLLYCQMKHSLLLPQSPRALRHPLQSLLRPLLRPGRQPHSEQTPHRFLLFARVLSQTTQHIPRQPLLPQSRYSRISCCRFSSIF